MYSNGILPIILQWSAYGLFISSMQLAGIIVHSICPFQLCDWLLGTTCWNLAPVKSPAILERPFRQFLGLKSKYGDLWLFPFWDICLLRGSIKEPKMLDCGLSQPIPSSSHWFIFCSNAERDPRWATFFTEKICGVPDRARVVCAAAAQISWLVPRIALIVCHTWSSIMSARHVEKRTRRLSGCVLHLARVAAKPESVPGTKCCL